MEEIKKCKGLSIASLVLGIVGIVLSIVFLGGILGIIGAILGLIAIIKSKPKSGMAIAGFILSIIAVLIVIGMVYIGTRDTTPPTIKQIANQVYIEDNINITNIVKVTDLNWEGQDNSNNVTIDYEPKQFSKEGKQNLKVIATDNGGNKTEKEIIVNVINPIMSIYDYIKLNISNNSYYTYTMENYKENNFSIKNTTKDGDYGIIDFTEKTIKEYSKISSFQFVDIMKFNDNLEITEIHRTSTMLGKVTNEYLDLKSDTAQSTIDVVKCKFEDILGKNTNLKVAGKTVEQLKNETIDLRELQ